MRRCRATLPGARCPRWASRALGRGPAQSQLRGAAAGSAGSTTTRPAAGGPSFLFPALSQLHSLARPQTLSVSLALALSLSRSLPHPSFAPSLPPSRNTRKRMTARLAARFPRAFASLLPRRRQSGDGPCGPTGLHPRPRLGRGAARPGPAQFRAWMVAGEARSSPWSRRSSDSAAGMAPARRPRSNEAARPCRGPEAAAAASRRAEG